MSLLGELAYVLLAQPRTSFAGIIPDVVVEEVPRDSLVITQHPVERGAAIADHAYRLPVILEVRAGFSNSTVGSEGYIDAVYEQVRQLQALREPFNVFTPRRLYSNMLLRGIVAPRDERTNGALFLSLIFEEVIITSTQQSSGGDQAMPSSTAGTSEGGSVQAGEPQGLENFQGTATVGGLAGDQPIGLGGLSGTPDGLSSPPGNQISVGEMTFNDGTTVTTLPADPSYNAPDTGFSVPNPDGYMNE